MDEHSWAWDIPSRKLLHDKSEDETCAKDEKLIPKVLALLVDMEEGTVSILIHPDMGLQSAFSGNLLIHSPYILVHRILNTCTCSPFWRVRSIQDFWQWVGCPY